MTRIELDGDDVVGIRAGNPGPFSLTGTNSWIVGRDPAWLIDPGPALDEHVRALQDELRARGGLGAIVLTHDHHDHTQAVPAIAESFAGALVAASRGEVDVVLSDGDQLGPLTAISTPGHASDHLAFLLTGRAVLFSGDAVLGEGSTIILPEPGALAGYLRALERLKALQPEVILPGHGPVVSDPIAKLDEYIAHRLERERLLIDALASGRRTVDELLDAAWSDVAPPMRPAAAVALAAHLDKLEDEGRLPDSVERPQGIEQLVRAAADAGA